MERDVVSQVENVRHSVLAHFPRVSQFGNDVQVFIHVHKGCKNVVQNGVRSVGCGKVRIQVRRIVSQRGDERPAIAGLRLGQCSGRRQRHRQHEGEVQDTDRFKRLHN